MAQMTCVARHIRDFFMLTLCYLAYFDLDLFKYALHTHSVHFVVIYPALKVSVSSLQPF